MKCLFHYKQASSQSWSACYSVPWTSKFKMSTKKIYLLKRRCLNLQRKIRKLESQSNPGNTRTLEMTGNWVRRYQKIQTVILFFLRFNNWRRKQESDLKTSKVNSFRFLQHQQLNSAVTKLISLQMTTKESFTIWMKILSYLHPLRILQQNCSQKRASVSFNWLSKPKQNLRKRNCHQNKKSIQQLNNQPKFLKRKQGKSFHWKKMSRVELTN